MLVAMRFPDGDERGRGKKGNTAKLVESTNFSVSRITHARTVYRYCPEMVEQIIEGKMGLDEAYAEALRFCAATRRA